MIKSVKILDPEYTPVEWWPKVFPEKREWEFVPGMNILWGKNGSGKTTLVKLLARMMHCEQGGVSTVTNTSVSALTNRRQDQRVDVEVEHDGTSAVYYDPTNAIGLMGGMSAFDYDFMDSGIMNATMHVSAGQMAMQRLHSSMSSYTPEITYKTVKSDWVEKLLAPSIKRGPQTLLMDEPDANLDWPTKLNLWTRLDLLAIEGRFQLIIATHSICALRLLKANVIEIPEEGYLKESTKAVTDAGFLSEEPITLDEILARRDLLGKDEK